MNVVVDLGCERHDRDRSIEPLVERFAPDTLYGFDPAATPPFAYTIDDTRVLIGQAAAWTDDAMIEFSPGNGIAATVMSESTAWNGATRMVACFDFSTWLRVLSDVEIVVKMDIEGAELPVLEKLIADGTDARIGLLLVEWHDGSFGEDFTARRSLVEAALRCPTEIWH